MDEKSATVLEALKMLGLSINGGFSSLLALYMFPTLRQAVRQMLTDIRRKLMRRLFCKTAQIHASSDENSLSDA